MFFYPEFKPVVLAIHGSASTAKQWRSLSAKLDPSVTFIAPDLPGYGQAAADSGTRLAALSHATAGRTARIHLIAHSFGGAVALKFANSFPMRVASVTLYDPIAATEDATGHTGLPPALAAIWDGFRNDTDSALMQAFLTFWGDKGAWSALTGAQRARLVAHASGLRRDMSEVATGQWSLDEIRYHGPLAILRGGRSPAVTRHMARAIASRHPQTILKDIDGLGHLAPLTHPDVVNQWLCQMLTAQGVDLDQPSHQQAPLAA